MKAPLRTILVLVATLAVSLPAGAQLFRAYLSSTGSDGNPCNLPSPCRLLPAALAAVADGGEIWMLDSANYNAGQVEVTKSVTILAIPGVVGSVVATGGGHGIHVNTAGVKVTLRNLVIVHLTSSLDGINFAQGDSLNVEGCEIANVSGNGINAPVGQVTVKDTVIREVGVAGVAVGAGSVSPSPVSLKRVHITGAAQYGVYLQFDGTATISESVITGSGTGIFVLSGVAGSPELMVERSVISGNTAGVQVFQVQPPNLNAGFFGNTISGNGTGMQVSGVSPAALVVLDGNSIAGPVGLTITGTPTIYTRGNNFISTVTGGSLTSLAAQ